MKLVFCQVARIFEYVSIPKRVLEALKPNALLENAKIKALVSIPKRVLEALKLTLKLVEMFMQ